MPILSVRSGALVLALCLVGCSKGAPDKPAPTTVEDEAPVEAAAPTTPPVAAAPNAEGECADMACFLAAAKECRKSTHVSTKELELMGMKHKITERLEIEGSEGDKCAFSRRALAVKLEIGAEMRAFLAEKGSTDADVDKMEREALANLQQQGNDVQRCVMAASALVKALEQESRGVFDTASWSDCAQPERQCPEPPGMLFPGCSLGGCESGGWPITCATPDGRTSHCRLDGTVAAGLAVGCSEEGRLRLGTP